MNKSRFWAVLPAVLLVALFIVPTSAFAHERRTVANGKYDVTVGWDVEPAYQGLKNAASIRIAQGGSNPAVPVTGAEKTLKVQIRQGATTKEFPLRAVFGQQGYYVADVVPTREGDYQWSFVGAINEDQVSERFDTADGKFNGVEPITALQFPVAAADPSQAIATAASAQQEVQSARNLAYVGIGLGILGLVAAVLALMSRSRSVPVVQRTSTEHA